MKKRYKQICAAAVTLFMVTGLSAYGAPASGTFNGTKPLKDTGKSEFQELRDKWMDTLLGGDLDTFNQAVLIYRDNIDAAAIENWTAMNKSSDYARKNLWDDLDMSYIAGTGAAAKVHSGNVSDTFSRLKSIAVAWATKGCALYQSEEVKAELILALDHMNKYHYSSSDEQTPFFGNWWHWEIGGPIAFLDTALILYDDLTAEQINSYAAAVDRFTNVCDKPSGYPGSPQMTGANLIDKGMVVVQTGLLTENGSKLEHVKKAYKTVFQYVKTGDGFYEDGSFIQHQALAYMGGYGSSLYEKLSILFQVLHGTKYELTYDDGAEKLIFDMVFEGIEPFLYNGVFMDMVSGRDITRKTAYDKKRGAKLLDAFLPIGDAMPEEQQKRFDSMVKYYIGLDPDFYYSQSTHIGSLIKANKIMKDDTIKAREGYTLHKLFAGMDKLVHIMPDYGFALSMHSSRTYGHELINDEGKRTWNISDGMTYLYLGDRDQYGDGYWATVDPKRLSGTTTEYVTRPNGAGDRTKNLYSWVGGSSLGDYGAVGMHYKTLGNSGNGRTGTDAKKSWFLFDDEIVALGSGITSTTGNYVETVVDNRKIRKDGSNKVIIDGNQFDIRDDGPENVLKGTMAAGTSWIYLEGNTENSDIGYYFPEKADIMALKEQRTGNWNMQGTTEGEETNQFATFWLEHGKKPTDAAYSYVLLPGKDAVSTGSYAQNPDIEILENSTGAHAVRENKLGITAVNFWGDEPKTTVGITSDCAASVIVQVTGDEVEIGVADPTQANVNGIQVSVPYTGGTIQEKDSNVKVLQTAPFIRISVDTKELTGKTSTIKMKLEKNNQREITGIEDIPEPIKVKLGTEFHEIQLPETIKVFDNTGQTESLAIVWDKSGYQKERYGAYPVTGTLTLPDDLYNTAGLTASAIILIEEEKTPSIGDVYVQGGTDSNKNYWGTKELIVKYDANSMNYTRKSIMKFNIADIPKDAKNIRLVFELMGKPSTDFQYANIYQVSDEWNPLEVTYQSFPARIAQEPVASFTKAMTDTSLIQMIEVTEPVREARKQGNNQISFEISIPVAAKNNYVGIYSSATGSNTAVKPALLWESGNTSGVR